MQDFSIIQMCCLLFFGSMLATSILTPAVMELARKIGAVDHGGYRKITVGAMPLLGGVAVALPFLAACALGALERSEIAAGVRAQPRDLAVLGIGGLVIILVGIIDDTRGMRARSKLLAQAAVALFVAMAGYTVESVDLPFVGTVYLGETAGTFVTVLWIVGLINAFNLVDGMDGLATGIALIGSLGLGVLAGMNDARMVMLLSAVLTGSLLAFLVYNFHPARIFLGDTGSMFVGYALATITLMSSYKSHATVLFVAPMLALSLPIFEVAVSVARRFVRGKPLFSGDQNHTHHRLLRSGFSQRQAALILYAASFACVVAAILFQVAYRYGQLAWVPIGIYLGTLTAIASVAGYLKVPELIRASNRRQHNLLLSAFARYAAQSLSSRSPLVSSGELMRLARRELGLRFLEAWFEDGPVQIVSSGRMRFRTPPEKSDHGEDFSAFVAAPDGFVAEEEISNLPVDLFQTLRVKVSGGHAIVVRYQHYVERDEMVKQDVAACLAQLFEQTRLYPPMSESADEGARSRQVARI